jgi:hypothetical protein
MPKIVARSTVERGYWAYGRQWPRDAQVEVEVSAEEYAKIVTDNNLVYLLVPEVAPVMASHHKAKHQSREE